MARARVPVGHHHLGDRSPVQHRTEPVALGVPDLVQDEPVVGVHRQPERPVLPAEEVRFDGEARPFRLDDLERLETGTGRLVVLGVVAAPLRGEGDDAVVDDLEHLAAGTVDGGDDSLDRAGVPVVRRCLPVVGEAPGDPAALLDGPPEVARRPGVDLDLIEVGDAPAPHGLLPIGVLAEGDDRAQRVVEQEGGPDVGPLLPGQDLLGAHVHDRLDDPTVRSRDDDQAHPPVNRVAGPVGGQRLLARRLEGDRGEPGVLVEPAPGPDGRHGGADLVGGEGFERMTHGPDRAGSCPRLRTGWAPLVGGRLSHGGAGPRVPLGDRGGVAPSGLQSGASHLVSTRS